MFGEFFFDMFDFEWLFEVLVDFDCFIVVDIELFEWFV